MVREMVLYAGLSAQSEPNVLAMVCAAVDDVQGFKALNLKQLSGISTACEIPPAVMMKTCMLLGTITSPFVFAVQMSHSIKLRKLKVTSRSKGARLRAGR